jgi:hypothetical protein
MVNDPDERIVGALGDPIMIPHRRMRGRSMTA